MTHIVVLRPEPGAGETVKRAQGQGLSAIALPLFAIEPLAWTAPDPAGFDGVLLTSANAIRAGGDGVERYRGLAAYTVGEATAAAARGAGFDIAAVGQAGVERLLQSIEPGLRLVHLCGEDRRQPVDAPQQLTAVPVYRAAEIDDADLSCASGAVVLVHSPRAGSRFAELVDRQQIERGSITIAAISDAARDACGNGWAAAEAAGQANDETLLALAASLCDKPRRG